MSSVGPPSIPYLVDVVFDRILFNSSIRLLGRFACVSRQFSLPIVRVAGESWSIVEEAARRRLAAESAQARGWASREHCGGSWLRALAEVERLRKPINVMMIADSLGLWVNAIGTEPMHRGRHYATFELTDISRGYVMIGVVSGQFNLRHHRLAQLSPQGWMMYTTTGSLWNDGRYVVWNGAPSSDAGTDLRQGDVIVSRPPTARLPG